MAKRGTRKFFSVQHEDFLAKTYGGRRSRSSGGADHEDGDVICDDLLIEAKATGLTKPAKSVSVRLDVLEKACQEAYQAGKTPMVALRLRNPDSFLADRGGNIDLAVYLVRDDIARRDS